MGEQLQWILLAVGEALLVLVLLLSVAWFRNLAARRRDRAAIRTLVAQTKQAKEQRKEEISGFLSSRFRMSGDTLAAMVRAVYNAEAGLIQTFANTYLKRDAGAAARFGREVAHGVEPYWSLEADVTAVDGAGEQAEQEEAEAAANAAPEGAEEETDDGEVARLRGENERLSEELRVTMDTMSRMLNEYSNIFAKDTDMAGITVVDEDDVAVTDDDAADPHVESESSVTAEEPTGDESTSTAAAASHADVVAPDDSGVEEPAAVESQEMVDTMADDAVSAATAPEVDREAVLAAEQAQGADEIGVDAAAEELDPDAILAANKAQEAGIAEAGAVPEERAQDAVPDTDKPAKPGQAVKDEFPLAEQLDPTMKDLSLDDEQDLAEAEEEIQRQRIIDADS